MSAPGRPHSAQHDLLDVVLGPDPPPFALLHRPETTGDTVDLLVGTVSTHDCIDEIPLPEPGREVLAILPYRQIAERGFPCLDDGEPLVVMTVAERASFGFFELLARLPKVATVLEHGHFDVPDDDYAEIVRRVVAEEIGQGEGANFVIRRSFVATMPNDAVTCILSALRRLLERESGAYWTFLFHAGERTFIGATPERHVTLSGGVAVMNPISGTYRFPPSGPVLEEVLDFLADEKERDELYMVVDEELKMMARICTDGGRVIGPYLKEMAWLAHTEYFIQGHTDCGPHRILRETMFAPSVTGSPIESACRVIARHEPTGRGYYSGVVALIANDDGCHNVDSAILIRVADIARGGEVRIGVGATLVRHSDPMSEVAETRAKASALLTAMSEDLHPRFAEHPSVRAALRRRNEHVSRFWLGRDTDPAPHVAHLAGRSVLVVDAEDNFTSMVAHQLCALGLVVTVRRFDERYAFDGFDLVVMGPGPGDPREASHPKIAHMIGAVDALLADRRPFLALCLSHQVLCHRLGFPLVRRAVPNQGIQRQIDLFGRMERVGFYNTFAATSASDVAECRGVGTVEVCRDPETAEVHALRGPHFVSLQFHAESILSEDGLRITSGFLRDLLGDEPPPGRPAPVATRATPGA